MIKGLLTSMPGNLWQNHRWIVTFGIAVLLLPVVMEDRYYLHMAVTVGLMAYLTMAWNIVGGLAGQDSFGHAAFIGVGAYTSTLLFIHYQITPWLGMLAGGVLAVLLSMVVGIPCFRLRGTFFSLSTLALAEVVRIIVINTETLGPFDVRGAAGILVPLKGNMPWLFQFNDKIWYYYIIWGMTMLVYYITYRLKTSKYGLFLAAVADDEEAAQANGVNVLKAKMLALVISAFLAALGGTFYAQFYRSVDPGNILSIPFSIELVLLGIVGGTKSIYGPIVGAVLLTPIGEYARVYLGGGFAGLHKVVYGLVLVGIILFLPNGLTSLPSVIRRRYRRAADGSGAKTAPKT